MDSFENLAFKLIITLPVLQQCYQGQVGNQAGNQEEENHEILYN